MTSTMVAKNIFKTFGSGHTLVTAVNDLSLEVSAGELVLIMGPSGSGKTTLLSILGAMLRPSQGEVYIENQPLSQLSDLQLANIRGSKIGFIFQAFNLLDALTVEENILFPSVLLPNNQETANERAKELMQRFNLLSRRHALPKTLSGGEKQRTAIARALINNPPIILADEPTGNLDSQSGQEVMMVLYEIAQEQGVSVILVTHDPRVEDIADRILWLEDGKLSNRQRQHNWSACPICNMRVDEWTAQFVLQDEDNRLVFCSQRCLEKFSNKQTAD